MKSALKTFFHFGRSCHWWLLAVYTMCALHSYCVKGFHFSHFLAFETLFFLPLLRFFFSSFKPFSRSFFIYCLRFSSIILLLRCHVNEVVRIFWFFFFSVQTVAGCEDKISLILRRFFAQRWA